MRSILDVPLGAPLLQRVVGRHTLANLPFNERCTSGAHTGFLVDRIAILGPNIVGDVDGCDVHPSGWNSDDLRFIEGLTEPHVNSASQHGAVALVRMCVWWDSRSGRKLDAKNVRPGLLFSAEKPCCLHPGDVRRTHPANTVRENGSRRGVLGNRKGGEGARNQQDDCDKLRHSMPPSKIMTL